MAKPQQEDMGEVSDALAILTRRTAWLEKCFVEEEDDLQQRDVHIDAMQKQIDAHLDLVRAQVTLLKKQIALFDSGFANLSMALKNSVKKDELERLCARIDRMALERVLTKRGLAREMDEMKRDREQSGSVSGDSMPRDSMPRGPVRGDPVPRDFSSDNKDGNDQESGLEKNLR